jgi:hypothetical protein
LNEKAAPFAFAKNVIPAPSKMPPKHVMIKSGFGGLNNHFSSSRNSPSVGTSDSAARNQLQTPT